MLKRRCFILIITFLLLGCASTGVPKANIPQNSKFLLINISMSKNQVNDLIGYETDMSMDATAKAYNPFYYGTDITRTILYYKGEGRIVLDGDDKVIKIEYDPQEDGYK
jgi:hypothetical protein